MSSLFASSIDWPNNYEAALKQAKAENKKVYLFITSDYCKWCREFEDITLKDEKILGLLKKDYVLLHLSKERHTIDKRFNEVSFLPKHFFSKS
ncbi:MAG: thioredoxin family protein [Sulfurimonas sp.]|nr:thioredoxin family protein [Sulfurimonas sp.]